MAHRENKGITFIEIILVVAMILSLGASVPPFISTFIVRNGLRDATNKVLGTIRKAQNYAMTSKNGQTWGVCLSGNNIRLFSGSCASPTISENFAKPSAVTITGLNETTFSQRGEPFGTLSITVSTNLGSKTISVNSAGGIDVN